MIRHRQNDMERAHFLLDSDKEEAAAFAASGERGIRRTFLDFGEIRDWAKALPGVSWETILAQPMTPARTIAWGKHHVAILFFDPAQGWNITAWPPDDPADFLLWNCEGPAWMLGRENLEGAVLTGRMPERLQTPLEWLQNDMRGIVIL